MLVARVIEAVRNTGKYLQISALFHRGSDCTRARLKSLFQVAGSVTGLACDFRVDPLKILRC